MTTKAFLLIIVMILDCVVCDTILESYYSGDVILHDIQDTYIVSDMEH